MGFERLAGAFGPFRLRHFDDQSLAHAQFERERRAQLMQRKRVNDHHDVGGRNVPQHPSNCLQGSPVLSGNKKATRSGVALQWTQTDH